MREAGLPCAPISNFFGARPAPGLITNFAASSRVGWQTDNTGGESKDWNAWALANHPICLQLLCGTSSPRWHSGALDWFVVGTQNAVWFKWQDSKPGTSPKKKRRRLRSRRDLIIIRDSTHDSEVGELHNILHNNRA